MGKVDLDAGDHGMEIESGGVELDAGIGRYAHTLIKWGSFTGIRTVGENSNTIMGKTNRGKCGEGIGRPRI